MENLDLYLKNLIGKDESKAQAAANYLIENSDDVLFCMLVEKSDFLFDFVRNNVNKRIEKAVNETNFINILKFFDIYSSYYDDLFASILSKYANENLTDEIFDFLEKGTLAQKTYASKYFFYIPDTVSLELLSKYAFSDDEFLAYNAAEALGQMQDDVSYDVALSNLSSEDDFERLKAVKFFTAYGRNYPLKEIFEALKTSKMPENIAGQIPYMVSLCELLKSDMQSEALLVLDNILSGIGEILPISDIFQFEMYEIIERLIDLNSTKNDLSGKISEILLKALSKFRLFCENQEYMFDEDKDTKYEVAAILKLLQGQNSGFWDKQKCFAVGELSSSEDRILAVMPIISEFGLKDAIPALKSLLGSENEIIVSEALTVLKSLDSIDDIDINSIVEKITNPNIKIFIENLKA